MEESVRHGAKKLGTATENLRDVEKTRESQSKTLAEFEKELGQLKKAQLKFDGKISLFFVFFVFLTVHCRGNEEKTGH